MGKNFCRIEGKWCKFCKKNYGCKFNHKQGSYTPLSDILKCPIREKNETISFRNLLFGVSFFDVMNAMKKYWPNEDRNIKGYQNVYVKLLDIHGTRSDMFISGEYLYYDNKQTCCPGLSVISKTRPKHLYSVDSFSWAEIVSMNITQETLDNMSAADIVAGVFYELTFSGFTEEEVNQFYKKLEDIIKNDIRSSI